MSVRGATARSAATAAWVVCVLAGCGRPPAPADAARADPVASPPAEVQPAPKIAEVQPAPKIAEAPAVTPPAEAPVVTPPAEPAVTPPADAPASASTCAPEVPATATLAERLDAFAAACGGVLLVTRDDGLHAMTPDLRPIARITETPVRQVRARREGDVRELYYFAADAPELVRHDLRGGRTQVLVKLPRLTHSCFTSAEPGEKARAADPIAYIQAEGDLDVDVAGGVLCLDVGDRNANMVSMIVNYRGDLRTGKVEQRTVYVGDDCEEGAGRVREAACEQRERATPEPTELPGIDQYGQRSPSGRWAFYRDDTFEQSGDYIYSAAFVYDTTAKAAHAVTPAGLVRIDYKARDAAKGPPPDTCMLPGEATAGWLPGRDVLVVEGCGRSGWLVVEPPGRVQAADAHAVAIY